MRGSVQRWAYVIVVTVPFVVFGCIGGYYDTTLSHLDYNGEQRPASIQVSDPQLYKREDLINERREETEYLKDLLNKSRTIEFAPELEGVSELLMPCQMDRPNS